MTRAILPAMAAALALPLALTGCGQKGPLYLPQPAGEIVTRPAATPAPAPDEDTEAPNSPQTVDSPVTSPSPAPEVTAPEGSTPEDEKKKNGTPPPR